MHNGTSVYLYAHGSMKSRGGLRKGFIITILFCNVLCLNTYIYTAFLLYVLKLNTNKIYLFNEPRKNVFQNAVYSIKIKMADIASKNFSEKITFNVLYEMELP